MRKFKDLPKALKVTCFISLAIVVILIIVGSVLTWAVMGLISPSYEPDIIIASPDGEYEIVAREWYFSHNGGTDLYIRKAGQDKWYNSWLEKYMGGLDSSIDNIFSAGYYEVEWDSDKVTIYYPKGRGKDGSLDRSTWRGILTYEFK